MSPHSSIMICAGGVERIETVPLRNATDLA